MKKIYLILIILIVFFATKAFLQTPNIEEITNNSGGPAAPSEAPQAALDCKKVIIDLLDKNDQSLSKYQVKSKEITYKNQKYKTVVYKCPDEKESNQNVFVLIKEEKILFSMTSERFDDINIRDINDDKSPELIITHWNGGECSTCVGQVAFKITNDGVKNILPEWLRSEEGVSNFWLSDLDQDKKEEILINDDSWIFHDGFFKSNAPNHVTVLTWEDGEYQIGGEIFSKYYLNQISYRTKELNKLLKNKNIRLNDIVGLAVENFWDYMEIEQNDKAYANFILETNIDNLPKTIILTDSDKTWLSGIRDEIEKEYKDARPTIKLLY